jgi:predicted glycoside hydrolase/deacetylase ChbG (UPF0249 family)
VPSRPVLIVNADDFGFSAGVNRGVIEAHERGIVTSTTLMVRGGAAAQAAAAVADHPALDVGLHLDLGEWEFVADEWRIRYQVVDPDDPVAVAEEVEAQLVLFEELVGRSPTHLDSHQHVHRSGPARTSLTAAGARLGIPVREVTGGIRYTGSFYGQSGKGHPVPGAISVEALTTLIEGLPDGVTELGCHPGLGAIDSVYGTERADEVATLCDPAVRAAVDAAEVVLCSFAELAHRSPPGASGAGADGGGPER